MYINPCSTGEFIQVADKSFINIENVKGIKESHNRIANWVEVSLFDDTFAKAYAPDSAIVIDGNIKIYNKTIDDVLLGFDYSYDSTTGKNLDVNG